MNKRSLEIKKRVFFSLRASNKGGVAISNHSVIASPPKAGVAIFHICHCEAFRKESRGNL